MPTLAPKRLPCSQPRRSIRNPADAPAHQATMLGLAPADVAPGWNYGAKVDLLELALVRHGVKSEAPYANLCLALAELAKEGQFCGLLVRSVSPHAIQANGYREAYRLEAGGREVLSVVCNPRRSYPNVPGIVIRLHCESLRRLGLEEDVHRLFESILPGGYSAFVTTIRRMELAYDVPADLAELVGWKEGNHKATQYVDTIYLGRRSSKQSLCCYDKGQQLREGGNDVSGKILRLEWRLKGFSLLGWKDALHQLTSLLRKFHFVTKVELAKSFPPASAPGLWIAAAKGDLTPVMQGLSKLKKKRLRDRLKQLPAPAWYQPDQIREALLKAAEDCPWLP